MALRRPPTTFSDSIDASDLAANSVTASELADNAVDADAIAANAVTTAKIADSSSTTTGITPAKIAENAVTSAKIATGAVIADGIGAGAVVAAGLGAGAVTSAKIANDAIEVKPHIKHGWLYPALKDTGGAVRQTDGVTAVVASTVGPAGSTIASSLYGTVQSDGKMYYYTDIKGSKPIKDPRIGSHFGSQRYKTTSIQRLEQETATHGSNVYSVDGREWVRFVSHTAYVGYDSYGNYISTSPAAATNEFIEIVCFANGLNYMTDSWTQQRNFTWAINGGSATTNTELVTGIATPLTGSPARFVGPFSAVNAFNGQSLGINTIRLNKVASHYLNIGAFELIAQDITSPTTRNQIQIHPQNVVSYGKRFAVGIAQSVTDKKALHYNPFAFKTDGSTAWASGAHNGTSWPVGTGSSHNIDTATSLGLAGWLHSSNYYKPYNGGRVVVWVDSAGTVKTSVNVMPPNARSIKNATITPKANASVANDTYLPTFEAGVATAYESTALAEVAKTFHWREFGNGAGNQGTGGGTWADASMLTTQDDVAFVMDDGLTSLSGKDAAYTGGGVNQDFHGQAGVSAHWYLTFIGTGISFVARENVAVGTNDGNRTIAQNLPYGTHIIKVLRDADISPDVTLDGVALLDITTALPYASFGEVTIHQPKRPPIPEDAVVIADYMLMADFKPQTAHTEGLISKGTRRISASRDFLYNHASSSAAKEINVMTHLAYSTVGPYTYIGNVAGMSTQQLPFFGASWTYQYHSLNPYMVTGGTTFTINGSNLSSYTLNADGGGGTSITSAGVLTKINATDQNSFLSAIGGTLGVSVWKQTETTASNKYTYGGDLNVASPIHTSSHYQTFETPFLHELVGGDRNMEQTNLVVTGDGKTWDEVTRDTSYIGNRDSSFSRSNNSAITSTSSWVFDDNRGVANKENLGNKNWCVGYDRLICLRDGAYTFMIGSATNTVHFVVYLNATSGTAFKQAHAENGTGHTSLNFMREFKRGDYIAISGGLSDGTSLGSVVRYTVCHILNHF
jgi:hypothetical protein